MVHDMTLLGKGSEVVYCGIVLNGGGVSCVIQGCCLVLADGRASL